MRPKMCQAGYISGVQPSLSRSTKSRKLVISPILYHQIIIPLFLMTFSSKWILHELIKKQKINKQAQFSFTFFGVFYQFLSSRFERLMEIGQGLADPLPGLLDVLHAVGKGKPYARRASKGFSHD